MRKTFQLRPEGKNPDRVLDAVKHEIRKYIRRERSHALPEGMDYWDFDCRFGTDAATAQSIHLSAITASVDEVAKAAGTQFYLEILARPARRGPRAERPADEGTADNDATHDDLD